MTPQCTRDLKHRLRSVSGWWISSLQYGRLRDAIFKDGVDAPCGS